MDLESIFKVTQIKSTPIRIKLLNLFLNHKHPVCYKTIEDRIGNNYDRVTLYRSLKLLLERNIIHKIDLNNSKTCYMINNNYSKEKHPHFYCNNCKEITCLPDGTIKNINLPSGFKQQSINLIVNGICNTCNV